MVTHNSKTGFTIVELLVVIVVIAILAAVTVTSFNGMSQRARNVSRVAAAQGYMKILQLYASQNGTYPLPTSHTCLGEGYPDFDSDGLPDCRDVVGGVNKNHENAASTVAMKTISRTLPRGDMTPVTNSGNGVKMLGVATEYSAKTYNGIPFDHQLIYYLEGANQNCQMPNLLDGMDGNSPWPTFTSPPVSKKNSDTGGSMTYCFVYLPQPNQ